MSKGILKRGVYATPHGHQTLHIYSDLQGAVISPEFHAREERAGALVKARGELDSQGLPTVLTS